MTVLTDRVGLRLTPKEAAELALVAATQAEYDRLLDRYVELPDGSAEAQRIGDRLDALRERYLPRVGTTEASC